VSLKKKSLLTTTTTTSIPFMSIDLIQNCRVELLLAVRGRYHLAKIG
jgi:hypothetical protein